MISRLCRPAQALLRAFGDDLRLRLTPHQYYITQGKGKERPFTGEFWNNRDLGNYHCVVCNSLLFPSLYKFYPSTGFCAFFATAPSAVKVESTASSSEQEVSCAKVKCRQCNSHLGHVFPEKRPPTNLHYQIKSGALTFVQKPWFPVPLSKNERRRKKVQAQLLKKKVEGS